MKIVWPLGVWGHDLDCKHRDFRDGDETPEYEGIGPLPLHTLEIEMFRSVFMDCGVIALEFTSCCYV